MLAHVNVWSPALEGVQWCTPDSAKNANLDHALEGPIVESGHQASLATYLELALSLDLDFDIRLQCNRLLERDRQNEHGGGN